MSGLLPAFICTALALVGSIVHAGDLVQGPMEARFISCYDGDTCTFDLQLWPGLTVHTAVRLRGVDAPEIRGKCDAEKSMAIEAKRFMELLLSESQTVYLTNIEPDKYGGRVVADIIIDLGYAADMLIAAGLARKYGGGTREGWCAS